LDTNNLPFILTSPVVVITEDESLEKVDVPVEFTFPSTVVPYITPPIHKLPIIDASLINIVLLKSVIPLITTFPSTFIFFFIPTPPAIVNAPVDDVVE